MLGWHCVQDCVCSRHKQYQLTQLNNWVHGANTTQNARQLILPDVCQPLCDGVLDHFVNTKETRKWCMRNTEKLTTKHSVYMIFKHLQTTEHIWDSCKYNTLSVNTNVFVCVCTHVCSRASSASTQNSLTGPDRSESLQMFPVKQRAGIKEWKNIS